MKDKLTAAERVAIEAWAAWYLQALTRHLKDVAAAKGRGAVDVPNPLTFAALLRVLARGVGASGDDGERAARSLASSTRSRRSPAGVSAPDLSVTFS